MTAADVDAATTAGGVAAASPTTTPSGQVQPWQDPWRLAQRLANTSWVPKPFRGKPEEVVGAILYGHELGLGPITSLKSIQLIDGVPTASASLMRALILRQGHILSWRHVSPEKVIVYGRRRDTGSESTVVWTIEMAAKAKLLGKQVWQMFPQSMLVARATSQIARGLFDDVLHGLIYTPEEMGAVAPPMDFIDVDELDVAPEDVDLETGEIVGGGAGVADDQYRPVASVPGEVGPPVPASPDTQLTLEDTPDE